jgi:DNA (cytosine-5)-methyltransferase 1
MSDKTKVIDLFCGGGGFSTGFEEQNFEVLAGVDINEDSLETFEDNHNSPSYNIDLSDIEPDNLLNEINVEENELDGIIGGPPCQGFSQAGDRNPDDDRNKLVKNYFDIIGEIEPEFFVMENVRAITYERNSYIIEYVENRIENLGYNYTRGVLNAANFGVPQTRKRLFIIGMKEDEPTLPNPTHTKDEWVGVNDVIDVPDGQIVSSYGTQETLRGDRNTRDTSQPSYTLRATRCLVDIIPNDYEPPDEDEDLPSITDVRIYRFTEEDAAKVQSFPEGYNFVGNLTSQRRQIGNAAPPKVAEMIAYEIKRCS